MMQIMCFLVTGLLLLCRRSVMAAAIDDVLLIDDDNPVDSLHPGAYYGQQPDLKSSSFIPPTV